MAMTKAELQSVIDQTSEILNEAYAPETSREDLATAVGQALDLLSGDDADEDDDDDDDESADDDDDVD